MSEPRSDAAAPRGRSSLLLSVTADALRACRAALLGGSHSLTAVRSPQRAAEPASATGFRHRRAQPACVTLVAESCST